MALPLPLLGQCVAALNDIIVVTEAEPFDEPGPRIVFVNAAFQRQTGYTPEEVIGRSPRLLQGPKTDAGELRRIGAALRRWEVVRAELVNYTKAGDEFHVEMDIVPIADANGRYTHWIAVQRDVTARKFAERQARLREAQRVESLGTLAAGIAHDFNNIVAAILGNVVIARQDIADGRSGLASLEQIHTAGIRARGVIQRVLDYSRREPQAFVRERLGQVVRESTELLRSALPSSIALNVRVDDGPMELLADATQLQQVLLNLGTNAWHAMDGRGGTIDVECRLMDAGVGAAVGAGVDAHDGAGFGAGRGAGRAAGIAVSGVDGSAWPCRRALIHFRDDGCGMDDATGARIFEPYFTTKAVGRGTGLGLFAAAGIVEAHGGRISVESAPGQGATFRIELPLLPVAPPAAAQAPSVTPTPAIPLTGRGERVLVVDDDEMVLLMLETVLSRAGYRVTALNDPVAALATVRADAPAAWDIVVTDHTMPVMSGIALAGELRARCPTLPIVIASGYLDDALRDAAAEVGAAAVVGKEFTTSELGGVLRAVLQARSTAGEGRAMTGAAGKTGAADAVV